MLRHKKLTVTLLFLTACLLQTLAFLCCSGQASLHLFSLSAKICATGFLILLPLFLLPRRWRWLQIVWMTAVAMVMIANVWYMRVFEDFMSPANVLLLSTVDSTITSGASAVMRWYDFLILLPGALCAVAYALMPKTVTHVPLGWRMRLSGCVLCLAVTGAGVVKLHRDYYLYLQAANYVHSLDDYFPIVNENLSRRQQVNVYGFAVAQTIELYKTVLGATKLDETDLQLIAEYASHKTGDLARRPSGRNMILIVVESLNSCAVTWQHDGQYAMPFTAGLLSDSAAVTFTDMVSIAGEARSADGQFMYHTGLFPLRGEPFVVTDASGPFPSLQRQLPDNYTSVEIIGEDATLWHHKETSAAYGFDRLFSDTATGADSAACQDEVILNRAVEIADSLPQPFYIMISTLTMHDPYIAPVNRPTWISAVDSLDNRDANYLERCRMFDQALAGFVAQLKQRGLWNNSIVAIVSDHEARRSCLSPRMNKGNQFFALLNTGLPGTHSNKPISQIDVYPTLVDALGMASSATWPGFGTSVLGGQPTGYALLPDATIAGAPTDTTAINRQRQAWLLSDKLIRARNKSAVMTLLMQGKN